MYPGTLVPPGTCVPITIAFWTCPQLQNIHLNETKKYSQSVCLSLAHMCMGRVRKYRNVHVIVYKSGLARCDDNLYKPITLIFPLFAWNSFLFIRSIISIRVRGSKFVPK